jgi:molybdopterin-biosynthesis enzyme MoeA-like protein
MIELLAIGNELLLGETVDTNSAWIARGLAAEGIAVRKTRWATTSPPSVRRSIRALRRTASSSAPAGSAPRPTT